LTERNFIPREIVDSLDRFIIGQEKAKRCVAIALRNRWRRQQVPEKLRDEIAPKNIEESMVTVVERAETMAEERILDLLLPQSHLKPMAPGEQHTPSADTREKLRRMLRNGEMDEREVDIQVEERSTPLVEIFSGPGMEGMDINLKDMMGNMFPGRKKPRKVKLPEAAELLAQEEAQKLIDMEKVTTEAINRVEQNGIIFLDEIDKITGRESAQGPDVSREGVQRDLLPIIEGTTVTTKHGMVKTDHVLFIAAGAFHGRKPSDLLPELQGRFPIRVELDALTREDFVRILTEPENALILQYTELMRTEGLELDFSPDAIEAIASMAEEVNTRTENIGARRLHTILEKLLEDLSFQAPDLTEKKIGIDSARVHEKLSDVVGDEDLSRYIL